MTIQVTRKDGTSFTVPTAKKHKKRSGKKKTTHPAHLTKAVTLAVQRLVKGDEETKYVAETLVDNQMFNSGIGSTNPLVPNEMYRCIPTVSQYSGDASKSYARIGKVIEPIGCKVHFRFTFDARDANARDLRVVLYMLDSKTWRAYQSGSPSQATPTTFLDNGQGSNVRFQGTYLDSIKPIDKDGWRLLHKKVFTIKKGMGLLNDNTPSTSQGSYSVKEFSLKVKMPKKLQYEETATTPAHYAPVWCAAYYYPDQTAPDLDLTPGCLMVSARTEMWYKDS